VDYTEALRVVIFTAKARAADWTYTPQKVAQLPDQLLEAIATLEEDL
jgi:hypothetical protein